MTKITRGNVAAARAQRAILLRRGKPVPLIVEKLANLNPDLLKPDKQEMVVRECPDGGRQPSKS